MNSMSEEPGTPFIDTVEGEISFFRSIMRTRPVGIHSQFHTLAIRNAILRDTGQTVTIDEIWKKLKGLYDLEALEGLENDGYDSAGSDASSHSAVRSPSPTQNLTKHPFFRQEFSLPMDETFDFLIASRRVRATASPPSSPPAPSPTRKTRGGHSKRAISKSDTAGLIGGDSDSSALTQESGDEGANTRESVATGTDGGSDAEEDASETREESAAPSASSKPPRNKAGKFQKKGPPPRTAAATVAAANRPRKRKR